MVMDRKPGASSLTATSMPGDSMAHGVGKQTMVGAVPQPASARSGGSVPAQVQPGADGSATRSPAAVASAGGRGQLDELLATPATPLGDQVVLYLQGLSLPAVLDELREAVECGYALRLEPRLATAPPVLSAALQAAELAGYSHLTPAHPALARTGEALDKISLDQQAAILAWMITRRGVSMQATTLIEGAIAIREGEPGADGAPADGQSATAQTGAVGAQVTKGRMPAPIEKGGWAPPGEQPVPLYVGTEVHKAIGEHYALAHQGQDVATNNTSIMTILKRFGDISKQPVNASVLTEQEALLRPDILNIDLRHVYEIKPEATLAQGRAKAAMYMTTMNKAGMKVTLGPMNDPGTTGALPAPDGTVMFECVEPGVITYRYRHSRLVPVPVPAPAKKRSRDWNWAFENDLTPEQRSAMVTTTVGGAVLILLMVVLAPVGA